jgi:hypothetical protein
MIKKLLYAWQTNANWEVFTTGALRATVKCPVSVGMDKLTVKAVYDPDFNEVVITADFKPPKKIKITDIEDATPCRQNSNCRCQSNGDSSKSNEPV